jgi:hypothetical protein
MIFRVAEQKMTRVGKLGAGGIVLCAACLLVFSFAPRFRGPWFAAFVIVPYFTFFPSVLCCIWSALIERPRWVGLLGIATGVLIVAQRSSWVILDSILLLPFYGLAFVIVYKLWSWRRARRPSGTV